MQVSKRYSIIDNKNKREFLLLKGLGCKHRKCTFCDYYLDSSSNKENNYLVNKKALDQVQGIYNKLEIVNSGSYFELDNKTKEYIKEICTKKNIKILYLENHYMYKNKILDLKKEYGKLNIEVVSKVGVETFDYMQREIIWKKGMGDVSPKEIASYFDEICLLFGFKNQNYKSMINDISIGISNFSRICINIASKNSKDLKIDNDVINCFIKDIYPKIKDDYRFDILLNNTDFGVG